MLMSRRLGAEPQLQQASANAPALKPGASGPGVAALQDLLADLGQALPRSLAKGPPDGVFGPETTAAVKRFQAAHQLEADGIAGAQTLAALDAIVLAHPRLEYPDPTLASISEASDRGRPLRLRRNAHW